MNPLNRAETYRRVDGKWEFRIVAAENGRTLCSSYQGYENRDDAAHSATRVMFSQADPVVTFAEDYKS